MPRKLQPISNGIQAKLETARVARLATLDTEYGPHIVPVCFAYDGKVFYVLFDRWRSSLMRRNRWPSDFFVNDALLLPAFV